MVKATTQVGGDAGSGQGGTAEVGCNAEGRFEIPEIAVGPLTLMLTFDRENGTRFAASRRSGCWSMPAG